MVTSLALIPLFYLYFKGKSFGLEGVTLQEGKHREHPDLVFEVLFSYKMNKTSLEKWLILGVERGKYKIYLENLVVAGDREVLKKQKDGGLSKGHKHQPERAPDGQSWNDLNN